MKPLIVSFHTPDHLYCHESNRLRSSLERLGLEHRIIERPSIGNWARNNHTKPRVIQQFHADGARPVLWIDVDSVVWSDPLRHLSGSHFDFAAAWHPYHGGSHLFASTAYFAASCHARDLIRDWIARCEAAPPAGRAYDWKQSDQLHLQAAVEEAQKHGLIAREFSPAMAFVHDTDRKRHGASITPIIEAFNVSWLGRNEGAAPDRVREIARSLDFSNVPPPGIDPLVVSFHTPDPRYSHEANHLRSSLEILRLPHWIPTRKPIGAWARNNHLKPEVIRQAHSRGTRPVLWTDADSMVWQDPWPTIEALGECDVAVCWHQFRGGPAVFASTVYFAPTPAAHAIIEDWIHRCHCGANEAAARPLDHNASDQPHLQRAIEDAVRHGRARCCALPTQLAFVHDTDRKRHPGIDPSEIVVEAFQASRLFKNPDRYLARTTDRDRRVEIGAAA